MPWTDAAGYKIREQISKLEAANGNLGVKVAVNKARIQMLVGRLAGVKTGDIVVSKSSRYRVAGILSEALPKKGKPVLSGFKIAKNGNLAKRRVEIQGAWSVEGPTIVPKKEIVRVSDLAGALAPSPSRKPTRKSASAKKTTRKTPTKRGPGRPNKKSLEDFTILGTA